MNKKHPDRPLLVKCCYLERYNKKIAFSSARNCTYGTLKNKVEECFQLSRTSVIIDYKDDDGEVYEIATDDELAEAISYFQAVAEDAPLSSAASILSGRSFGSKKIILRLRVSVDYDGPSLSDTGSLASLDEYPHRNGSRLSFSLGGRSELDDDSVTVSSRDIGSRSARNGRLSPLPGSVTGQSARDAISRSTRHTQSNMSEHPLSQSQIHRDPFSDSNQALLPPPDAVFERLRLEEDTSSDFYDPIADSRGTAWLRDQNQRAVRSKLGVLPEPSVSDGSSLIIDEDQQVGALSLKRAPTGKFYYSYTSGSSEASHVQEPDTADVPQYEIDPSIEGGINGKPRPTSRQLNWVAAQQEAVAVNKPQLKTSRSDSSLETIIPSIIIPPELLQDIPFAPPGEEDLTRCSECGSLLNYMKYVCYSCGEKEPGYLKSPVSPKGKARDSTEPVFRYPPTPHNHSPHQVYSHALSPTFSSSSKTFLDFDPMQQPPRRKPLPPEPSLSSQSTLVVNHPHRRETGYELCHACVETAGVTHAIEAVVAPGSSPTASSVSPSSPEDEDAALQWRRAAPLQKGQLRHAYLEKMWGHGGWQDVVQSEADTENCSACGVTASLHKLYKCASCQRHYLCRACYSQVHDLHPSHAFLVLPDKLMRSDSNPDLFPNLPPDPSDERSMVHPGVHCAHCLLEIVGARFHCAECDSVDICSNCESAGLPGNIDSSDGGHISSHILIKIPFPLANNKVQSVSRKAISLWTRDPANVNRPGKSKPKSDISSYARTVVGTGSMHPSESSFNDSHGISCNGCGKPIFGVRYQCANCPAPQNGYNLCASCEVKSYAYHDPYHAFFKLPRPVNRPIRSNVPMITVLYKTPAGPSSASYDNRDPTGYLKSIVHAAAVCDRCVTRIQGAWFHCAHCGKDLCSGCESVDTHNDCHVFLVLKAIIDMQTFKTLMVEVDSNPASKPVIPYAVYTSS